MYEVHYPDIVKALPLFVMEKLPPLAGRSLWPTVNSRCRHGLKHCLRDERYGLQRYLQDLINRQASDKQSLAVSRFVIVITLVIAGFLVRNLGSLILDWSFLSMGLRGSVALHLCTALFLPERYRKFAMASIIIGPVLVVVSKLMRLAILSSFPRVLGSMIVLAVGYAVERRQ